MTDSRSSAQFCVLARGFHRLLGSGRTGTPADAANRPQQFLSLTAPAVQGEGPMNVCPLIARASQRDSPEEIRSPDDCIHALFFRDTR